MARQRSAADEQVADLLRTAKAGLSLSVAFLSRLDGTTQHLEVVESSVPFLFREGVTQPQATTFCQAILDGRLPAVIPDVRKHPEAMRLPAAPSSGTSERSPPAITPRRASSSCAFSWHRRPSPAPSRRS